MKKNTLPRDKYNHIDLPDAKTDPYGELEFAVGSGDDFHCFDYAIFEHAGTPYIALHSVCNSETGGFALASLTPGSWRTRQI